MMYTLLVEPTGHQTSQRCIPTFAYVFLLSFPLVRVDISCYQRSDVIRAIHATDAVAQWEECRSKIHRDFSTRQSNASITILPRVLEKIPVMLFAGDQDLICNYVGLESMMQSMTWNGETGLGVR
jgi:carboxypeptidase C (cathepsin A)